MALNTKQLIVLRERKDDVLAAIHASRQLVSQHRNNHLDAIVARELGDLGQLVTVHKLLLIIQDEMKAIDPLLVGEACRSSTELIANVFDSLDGLITLRQRKEGRSRTTVLRIEGILLLMATAGGPMDRKRLIEEAIHSGEMEGAYVSAKFREDADEYVRGDISIEDLMKRTKRRWNSESRSM